MKGFAEAGDRRLPAAAGGGPLPPMLELPEGDFAGYIFDCDGTLADSMPIHFRAWHHAFTQHGARFRFDWELFYSLAGVGHRDSVELLNERFADTLDPAAVIATQAERLETSFHEVGPIEPVVTIARELAAVHPVSVGSGSSRRHVLAALEAIGMAEFFEHIVSKDDVSRSKPDPETFLRCAELMGVAPDRCLVFEDGALGLEAAQSAGMATVFVDADRFGRRVEIT